MSGYKTTVAEDLEAELEDAKADGLCFEPGNKINIINTDHYLKQVFEESPLDARVNAGVAREMIRSAAFDGKDVQDYIMIFDDYCAEHGICVKDTRSFRAGTLRRK